MFDTSGSSGQLRGGRPSIAYGQVWCEVCDKPCDFDESGAHNLWGKPDSAGYTRGRIYVRAYCHNDEADIILTFEQARLNEGSRIVAFAKPMLAAAPVFTLPPMPLLLMDRQPEPSIESKI